MKKYYLNLDFYWSEKEICLGKLKKLQNISQNICSSDVSENLFVGVLPKACSDKIVDAYGMRCEERSTGLVFV